MTWRNDRIVPIKATAPISALRPGLAKKATVSCLYSTTVTSAHSTRNTSIRTRKIRGEDSLLSSISISEREEWPEGICKCHPLRKAALGTNMAQRAGERSRESRDIGRQKWNLCLKPDFDINVFCNGLMSNRDRSQRIVAGRR